MEFRNLGMVVADEQQRFGVAQRKALRSKGTGTDFLLMSATPIPRTLASTLYGDMDVSTIETMPAGRKTPKTVYIEENSFRTVLKDVQALLAEGHQLYIICAAVDFNEAYEAR
ncbi:MAG: ATP-dependent DNA helicase RecG, partial [Erysipelotrichaceae bacterium]|nr:ATP-dependent DNA helicase RecG [Erysipelotrichaceae bacterium]